MQTSTNNTTNTTLNQLVYEPVPPINPLNKEEQASINPIHPPGNLADQAGPELSTRRAQPIAIGIRNIRQRMYEADQLLKKGQKEEAGLIYLSITSNTDADIRDRLNCAKKLLKISSQAAIAANLLVGIAKDANVEGADRLEAIQHLAQYEGFQNHALAAFYAFSAVFESQAIEPWIPSAAGTCIAPILLAKAQDPQNWPLDRIEAAKKLSQIPGQAEKAAELLIAIAQDNNYHSVYRKKAAKLVSKLKEQATQNRGKELLKAIKIEDLVRKSLSKDKKEANRCYAAEYLSGRCYAAEKLSNMSGQETEAIAAWIAIVNHTKPDSENDKIRLNDAVRLSYCIRAAERLAGMKDKDSQILAVNTLEAIKNNVTLKFSFRTEAAAALFRITQGTELVDFLFDLVKDVTVLFFDRLEAAERLAKLVDEDEQGKVWTLLLNERHSYLDGDTGIKIAKKLSKIKKYEAIAANYFIYIGRYPCLFWNSVFTYRFIKACKHLGKIPGYEGIAAELLIKKSDLIVGRLEKSKCSGTTSDELLDLYQVAKALQEIPGQEENTARIWLTIMQYDTNQRNLQYIAQRLIRIPGHEEKAKTVWLYIQSIEEKFKSPALKAIHEIMSARGLFEAGETEKAAEILITCAEDKTQSTDRRMLAVQNLEKIPGQENKVKELKAAIKQAQTNTDAAIVAAKNRLQIPEEKDQGANDLLSTAKNTAIAFSDRMLAAEALCALPELHPKAIEALDFIAKDNTLFRDKHVLAAEMLSKIPGQAENARKIADSHMISISDESRYFKI